jgi:hypothetical protein
MACRIDVKQDVLREVFGVHPVQPAKQEVSSDARKKGLKERAKVLFFTCPQKKLYRLLLFHEKNLRREKNAPRAGPST